MKIFKNSLVVSIVFLLLLLTFVACDEQVEMKKYTSNAGRFSLMVPGVPEEKSTPISDQGISVIVKTFIIDKSSVGYIVSYVDYPSEVVNDNDPDDLLIGARNGLLAKLDGELISEERISYDKDPAIELHYTVKAKTGLGHTVLLLSGQRLYQVGAIGANDAFPSDTVQKYIDSFEIW